MKAIRGATTIDCDSPEQIRAAVKELLVGIFQENNLKLDDVVFILFSTTSDVKSLYPAKAARECGYTGIPLYSSAEPDIDGSLRLCIRLLALVEKKNLKNVKHIYLRGAKVLRPDLSEGITDNKESGRVINIAIDGPAGSGKTTVAREVAKKLDILCLDTGEMYRSIALKCARAQINYADADAVRYILNTTMLEVSYKDGKQLNILDGEEVSQYLHTPQITMVASFVSAYSFVRAKMVELQRQIAAKYSCILNGRDIGTNVLPDCKLKFYLTATPEVRAKRRFEEAKSAGSTQTFEEVLRDLNERDFNDSHRAVAPLKQAQDARVIDTSDLTIEQVVNCVIESIR